jgi:hypothetical protein
MDNENKILIEEITQLIEELITVICNKDALKLDNNNNNNKENDTDEDEKTVNNIQDTSLIDQTHLSEINDDHNKEEVRSFFFNRNYSIN